MQYRNPQKIQQTEKLYDFSNLKSELKSSIREDQNYSNTDNAKKKAAQQCEIKRYGLRQFQTNGFRRKFEIHENTRSTIHLHCTKKIRTKL